VFFSYPLDLLRVRLALAENTQTSLSLLETCKIIYNEQPSHSLRISNFYKGFAPTIYGMIPYAGVSFLTYENLKNYAYSFQYTTVLDDNGKRRLKAWAYLGCGALSGVLAQTASYPLEVIRRVMQIGGSSQMPATVVYSSTLHAAKDILRRRGFRGFWVGLSIGYLKVTPMFAISFYVYEYMKKTLEI